MLGQFAIGSAWSGYWSPLYNLPTGHPSISDVAVVGLEDEVWGERVVAVVETDLSQEQFDLLNVR